MKKILPILILSLWSFSLFAQKEVLFEKKNFKNNKSAFKEAEDHLKNADDFMQALPFPHYSRALKEYLIAQKFNPNSSRVNYNIGLCYLHSVKKFKALTYFQNAFQLNPIKFPQIHYYLGRGYHLKMEWDEAIGHYMTYRKRINRTKDMEEYMKASKRIKECRSGKKLIQHPTRAWIDNLGANINSKYPDYGMVITADAMRMFFTSRRASTTGGEKDPYFDMYFEDIYTSNRYQSKNWSPVKNIGEPINTEEHDAVVALSPDGGRIITYHDDKGDGNLYESFWEEGKWSKLENLEDINSQYHESSAWYTPDERQLFFVSDRPEVKGNAPGSRDIFVATWNTDKERWENIQRLPSTINTKYDEDGIYVHPDGKTIYFSSKGHNSMGGYDVFKSVRQPSGAWSTPVNMGYPINTPDDDVFFVVAANGRDAYMTSYRKEGYGDKDLYKVTLLGPKKEPILLGEGRLLANAEAPKQTARIEPKVEVKGSQLMLLKGIIRDAKTKEPLEANIILVDNETGEVVAKFSSDGKTGRYLVALPGGKNYGIAVKKEDYLFHSENFIVPKNTGYKEVVKNIDLKKINVGESIVLRNIFFDLDKYSLRPESKVELNRLIKLLNDNPSLKIEISGYTDSRGADAYNQKLSENRSKSVVTYLIEHGISAGRLTYKGYGEANPIVPDAEILQMKSGADRNAAYQKNRRTEFKVLSK